MLAGANAACGNAIVPLGHDLVADAHLLVPPLDESVAFEARHELVEGRGAALHAPVDGGIPDNASGLVTGGKDAEGEELQV